ncbi:MAG TPA: hypothetical protein VJW73_20000 [Gemmatimonadaceae bacterium]|nr:hypothetical protein [Gemmatimonadaceae bacterium]
MSDEQLRQLYARATAARTGPGRAECPAPEVLEALARREGPEQQRLETLDHVMSCPDCRQEFELFRAIEHTRRAETGAAAAHARWRQPLYLTIGAALAASAALVVVLGPWSNRQGSRDPSAVMRGATNGLALAAPATDTTLTAGDAIFVWRSVPDARRYTLEVLTPSGAVRARRETSDTIAAIPAAELGTGDLRWGVRAEMDGGEVRSPTRRLRVRAP